MKPNTAYVILRDGKILIHTPYDAIYVDAIKQIPPSHREWNAKHSYWIVWGRYRDAAIELVKERFPLYHIKDEQSDPDLEFERQFNEEQDRKRREEESRQHSYNDWEPPKNTTYTYPNACVILGCRSTAPFMELKKAYRDMAKKHHPDVNKGDKRSEEFFKKVVNAWEVVNEHHNQAKGL